MRTQQEIEKQLTNNGFTVWAILGGKKIQAMDSFGINVIVDISEEENFELIWQVPKSVAKITIGPCSPFHSLKHFLKMRLQMIDIIRPLREGI